MQLKMSLVNQRELLRKLNALDNRLRSDIARKGLSQAASPVLAAQRRTAPEDDGTLRRSLRKKVRQRGGFSYAVVGPSIPEGAHAHLTHGGTQERVQSSTGRRVGKVVATHWMTRAFYQSVTQASAILSSYIARRLRRA